MGKRLMVAFSLCAALAIIVISPQAALAYDSYSGCSTCHPDFQGKGPTHDLHVKSGMTNNCLLCHTNPGDTPKTWTSGDGIGCSGCHGRDYGGSTGVKCAGLRAHHAASGVTTCGICHSTDPTPLSESTLPPYYSRADVEVKNACEPSIVGGEDWSGDGQGLDNDGDTLYDMDDPDCQVPVEQSTWGVIKALYRVER